jgi:hypothetical protein
MTSASQLCCPRCGMQDEQGSEKGYRSKKQCSALNCGHDQVFKACFLLQWLESSTATMPILLVSSSYAINRS